MNERNDYLDLTYDIINDTRSINDEILLTKLNTLVDKLPLVTPCKLNKILIKLKKAGVLMFDEESKTYSKTTYIQYGESVTCNKCGKTHTYESEGAACIIVFGKCCVSKISKEELALIREICERRSRIKFRLIINHKKLPKVISNINKGKFKYNEKKQTINGLSLLTIVSGLILDHVKTHTTCPSIELKNLIHTKLDMDLYELVFNCLEMLVNAGLATPTTIGFIFKTDLI